MPFRALSTVLARWRRTRRPRNLTGRVSESGPQLVTPPYQWLPQAPARGRHARRDET